MNQALDIGHATREVEKQIEELCQALLGEKPIRGMPLLDAAKIVIKALEMGLSYKLKLEGGHG